MDLRHKGVVSVVDTLLEKRLTIGLCSSICVPSILSSLSQRAKAQDSTVVVKKRLYILVIKNQRRSVLLSIVDI